MHWNFPGHRTLAMRVESALAAGRRIGSSRHHAPRPLTPAGEAQLVPTGGPLGTHVRGLDLGQPQPQAVIDALVDAFHAYHLLIFRGQQLSHERMIEVAGWFGEVHEACPEYPELGDASQSPVVVISNTHERGVLGSYSIAPHSDQQYLPVPALGSVLHAIRIPTRGGYTSWSNLHRAYEELNETTRERIEGLSVWAENPWGARGRHYPFGGDHQRYVDSELPRFSHPLVRTHPVTCRKLLYLSQYPEMGLVGLDDSQEAAELLASLQGWVDRARFYYTHRWRPGDVVIFDNRSTNHKRAAFPASQERLLYRVQIRGEKPA